MAPNITDEQRANVVKVIAALRSGKFQQCRAILRDSFGSYCATGVAAVSCGREIPMGEGTGDDYIFVRESLGLGGINRLWVLNDLKGKTFTQIADALERNLIDNCDDMFIEQPSAPAETIASALAADVGFVRTVEQQNRSIEHATNY